MTLPYRGRFAPSPSGPLHLGSLLAAFGSWLLARHAGGAWIVRMEDLDPPREVPGAARHQLRTLSAFGLESDEPVQFQSARGDHYAMQLVRLLADGAAFECRCSRTLLAASGGIHRTCVSGAQRSGPAYRLRVADGSVVAFDDTLQGRIVQDVSREVGDFVLRRTDGLWAYQLAVVADDHAQGITHVVRGADLLDSTPRQILLQRALGFATQQYTHLPVLLDANGRKLSKSLDAIPVADDDPLPALRLIWRALGQDDGAIAAGSVAASLRAALRAFDPSRLPRTRTLSLAALHNGLRRNRV